MTESSSDMSGVQTKFEITLLSKRTSLQGLKYSRTYRNLRLLHLPVVWRLEERARASRQIKIDNDSVPDHGIAWIRFNFRVIAFYVVISLDCYFSPWCACSAFHCSSPWPVVTRTHQMSRLLGPIQSMCPSLTILKFQNHLFFTPADTTQHTATITTHNTHITTTTVTTTHSTQQIAQKQQDKHNTKNRGENEQLTVFLIPHTHDDVGWLMTVDEYYLDQVQWILGLFSCFCFVCCVLLCCSRVVCERVFCVVCLFVVCEHVFGWL